MSECTSLTLETDILRLVLLPEAGARVIELTDRRSGRNWVHPVPSPAPLDAPKGGDIFVGRGCGWDECFPTIAADREGGAPRDHGDLWDRPHACEVGTNSILSTYVGTGYRFQRRLSVTGNMVKADYNVARPADSDGPMPWIWSQHFILNARPGEQILLDGLDPAVPNLHPGLADLEVPGIEAGIVQKTYAPARSSAAPGVSGTEGTIRFRWDGAQIGWCGLWLSFGGRPAHAQVHRMAIEPATAPAESITAARTKGGLRTLMPGEHAAWSLTICLDPPG